MASYPIADGQSAYLATCMANDIVGWAPGKVTIQVLNAERRHSERLFDSAFTWVANEEGLAC